MNEVGDWNRHHTPLIPHQQHQRVTTDGAVPSCLENSLR